MITRIFAMVMLMSVVSIAYASESKTAAPPANPVREAPRRMKISQPVYATTAPEAVQRVSPDEMTAAQRQKFEENRRRRIEIMMLLGTYKIMPEAQRLPIKNELLKRIEADFQAMIISQKERIAQAELDLKRFRAELADREARREELVRREFERLLNLSMPGSSSAQKTAK